MNNKMLESLGLSIVHSLWQGAILLFLVLLAMVMLRNKSAKLRYTVTLIGTLALPAMLLFNLVFFWPQKPVEKPGASAMSEIHLSPNLSSDFQDFAENPQNSPTLLWIKENAPAIALLWVAGMILFLIKVLGSFIWMKRLVSKASYLDGSSINTLLTRVKAILGINRHLIVKSSSWIKSPVILGFIRPTILFPIGLIEGLTTEEVEAILFHELAHLKRNDFVINIIINVLQIVFFYHPAYWWLKSQLDNEREYATDELALKYSEKKLPMIKALAKVQAFSMNQPALAFAGNSKNQVLKRINTMMNSKQQPNWLSAIFTIALLLVAFGVMSVQDTNPKKGKKDEAPANGKIFIDLDTVQNLNSGHYMDLDLDAQPQDNDSSAVSKAILEFVSSPESLKVSLNSSGDVISISRNGSSLNGQELRVYKKAYARLSSFSQKSNPTNDELKELREQLKAREEEIARKQNKATQFYLNENGKVDSVLINGKLLRGEERERYIKEFEQSRISSSLNGHLQSLEIQQKKVRQQMEQLLNSEEQLDQKNTQQVQEFQNRIAVLEKQIQEVRKADYFNRQIDQELIKRNLEREYLMLQDSLKKVAYFGNTLDSADVEWINKYQALLKPLEEKLKSLDSRLVLEDKAKIEALQRQIEEIKSEMRHNEEFVNIVVPRGDQRLEFAKTFLIDAIHPNTLIEMNGEFHPSMKLADLTEEDIMAIESIDLIKGSQMLNQGAAELIKGKSQIMRLNKAKVVITASTPNHTTYVFNSVEGKEFFFETTRLKKYEENGKLLIEFEGKLKENWTLNDLRENHLKEIKNMELIKGVDMENYYPKRKLEGVNALLRVNPKK